MNKLGNKTETEPIAWSEFESIEKQLFKKAVTSSKRHLKLRYTRQYMLLISGCKYGLRIGDMLLLTWDQLINEGDTIVKEKKTGKARTLTIGSNTAKRASKLYKLIDAKASDYVFASRTGKPFSFQFADMLIKAMFTDYKVPVKNPSSHTLRKTFGMRVYNKGGEDALVMLSQILNHSSIAITRRYIGITQRDIAKVYLSLD